MRSNWILVILLIVGGALCAASLIAKKNENAGEMLKKLAPYQSYIGLAILALGVWHIISVIRYLSLFTYLLKAIPVTGIVIIASPFVEFLVGLLLSMNFLKARKEIPQEKLEAIEKKLSPIQIPIGLVSMGVGVYTLLWSFVKWGF